MHSHDEGQLIFAASGTMHVYTASGRWLVPPQLAVWVPAGVHHAVEMISEAELMTIYWPRLIVQKWAGSAALDRAFALRVTTLLRELIFAAMSQERMPERSEHVVRLILHELIETPDAPTYLPIPESTVGRRVAAVLLADRQNQLDIGEIASRAATSVRTISRLFPVETGLTYKAWRQRFRIVMTLEQLSCGAAIYKVAADAGFASPAAFSFAFRQVTSLTPKEFMSAAFLR